MADRVEELADITFATVVPGMTGPNLYLVEPLSQEEQGLVDNLVLRIMNFVNELNRLTKPIAKLAANRLVEKLRLASLPEGSVGTIAEGVWERLKNASDVLGEMDFISEAELQIVEDIMHRFDESDRLTPRFINSPKKVVLDSLASIDNSVNGRIIRAAAKIAWPQVKAKLGI